MNRARVKNNKSKLDSELDQLRSEVSQLRSIIISILGEDNEGRYQASFVKTILKAAKEPANFEFTKPEALITQLKQV